jgi:hypothetical protein
MKTFIPLLFLLILSSCNKNPVDEKYEKKIVKNRYSIFIPESLEETTELNNLASTQFKNLSEDFYVIVLDETKNSFANAVENNPTSITPDLEGYYNVIVSHFKKITQKDFKVYDIEKKKINSSNAIVFSMSGMNDNYPAFYRYAIIEGDQQYYQIMSWTNIPQEKKYTERMNKIIESFSVEEINSSRNKSHLAKDKTKKEKLELQKNNSTEISYEKPDDEIQEIGNLFRPEIMQQEKIKLKNGKNNYQYTLTNSDLLDKDLENIKNHSKKIAINYYNLLKRTNNSFSYNKIIVKVIHRNNKIDRFEYSEKDIKDISK